MVKKIAVITATRAEYGLLSPVIRELRKYEGKTFSVSLVVTGTHLIEAYGKTIDEIKNDGLRIDDVIKIPVFSLSSLDISHNQAETLIKFTELFIKRKFDAVMLLGDRYETLAMAVAAVNTRTPVFHLFGGDVTEGAIDDCIRHSITKMSYLHFVSNEESKKRVIQLGEEPCRVFNYGSTSIDNMMKKANMDKMEVLESIGLADCTYALCTYHPVTLSDKSIEGQMENFLAAIRDIPDIKFIVTKSNADQGGARINEILDREEVQIPNLYVYCSLGTRKYLSLMKHAEFVLGNSSSGILETPGFGIPTVNIGDRQKGRLRAANVIDCRDDAESIVSAVQKARSENFKVVCRQTENPYGKGNASKLIAKKCIEVIEKEIDIMKKFYNLPVICEER